MPTSTPRAQRGHKGREEQCECAGRQTHCCARRGARALRQYRGFETSKCGPWMLCRYSYEY
eukprot:scaffold13145_cov132-Isochrysis_galbana.AAC.1